MIRSYVSALAVSTAVLIGSTGARAGEHPGDLRISLSSLPGKIQKGIAATLTLDIRDSANRPVGDLPIVHERAIHLIIVPDDLSQLAHLHPTKVARGVYRTKYIFPGGGTYRVYADLKSPGGVPLVRPFTLEVQGGDDPEISLEEGLSRGDRGEAGGIRAERISPDRIRAGAPVELGFALTDTRSGGPASDLTPYLGTMAHVIIISKDGGEFLHAHTMEGGTPPATGDHDGHAMHAGHTMAARSAATMLTVHTTFPHAGLYRVWMQVQRKKQVITLPFVVSVSE